MAFHIFEDLRQLCQERSSFKALAIKLDWPEKRLAAFFDGQDECMDSIFRVSIALGVEVDIVFTPQKVQP